MSGLPERVVGLAARILPPSVRERYREEWLADVAAAPQLGVRPGGVALGALLFSVTLDRDAPEISGVPLSVTVRRQARWGLAFVAASAVLAIGGFFVGGYDAASRPTWPPLSVFLGFAGAAVPFLAAVLVVVGLAQFWRAAWKTSPLTKLTAALATAGLGLAVLTPVLRETFGLVALASLALLLAAGVFGLIVWTGSLAAAPDPGGAPRAVAHDEPAGSRPLRRLVLWLSSLVLFGLVAVGGLDLIVWAPLARAPGYELADIYAALSPADRIGGLAAAWTWVGFWSAVVLVFLVLGLVGIARGRFPGIRSLCAVALFLAGMLVFFQFWAGFSLGMSISDRLPPYEGGASPVGYLFALVGQLSLASACIVTVTPWRPARQLATT
ncbi:hypothetical protein [Compostimonas suwonensis]|uniref:Uncharacterized protein n=1 Tax=Compostimonas suwonensis TaxID=1048394 RepID=A0A2M9BZJ6_9MICO|nr:hypothetical protein [Compostimonas suwonensis]PJJ63502.1 hypothetical protein CLV54_1170 [Compostimonas suwonensis]